MLFENYSVSSSLLSSSIIEVILKMNKKQVRLLKRGYIMINDNEIEAENEK